MPHKHTSYICHTSPPLSTSHLFHISTIYHTCCMSMHTPLAAPPNSAALAHLMIQTSITLTCHGTSALLTFVTPLPLYHTTSILFLHIHTCRTSTHMPLAAPPNSTALAHPMTHGLPQFTQHSPVPLDNAFEFSQPRSKVPCYQ